MSDDYIPVHTEIKTQLFPSPSRGSEMSYKFCFGYVDWNRNNDFRLSFWILLIDHSKNDKPWYYLSPHLIVEDGVIEGFYKFTSECKIKFEKYFEKKG